MNITAEEIVEQAVRRSHCVRAGQEHNCVGSCTIKPDGIELNCVLCGRDDGRTFTIEEQNTASRIFDAAGISLRCLSGESQVRVLSVYHDIVNEILRRNGLRA